MGRIESEFFDEDLWLDYDDFISFEEKGEILLKNKNFPSDVNVGDTIRVVCLCYGEAKAEITFFERPNIHSDMVKYEIEKKFLIFK